MQHTHLTSITIIVMAAGGLLTALVAALRNRSVLGWCLAGCLFPLLALLAVTFSTTIHEPMPADDPDA